MPHRRNGASSSPKSYRAELAHAMSVFFPHAGLPLLSGDGRVRWTSRMLAMLAIFMAWSPSRTLLDRFGQARQTLVGIHPTRRRPGVTPEGFAKALASHGVGILAFLAGHWRSCVQQVALSCWTVEGWALFGTDGSKFNCPRTRANEETLGVSGKNNSGPQLLLTCLFHVGSGLLWGWVGNAMRGHSERGQLRQLLPLLPKGAMLVADAGFHGYDLLRALLAQGNHFLIRVGANVNLIKKLGQATREGRDIVYLWPLKQQGREWSKKGRRRLAGVLPPLRLRLIQLKDAKGKPVFLLTDVLDQSQLRDQAAARMYRLRWGVEVMWRGLKQTMGHHKMLSGAPDRAVAELDWAMAGLWMMQLLAVRRMVESGQMPKSYSPAATLRVLQQAMTSKREKRRSLRTELGNAVKDTYARHGCKTARHQLRRRPQRPPGAPLARMATRIEKTLFRRLLEQPPPKSLAA
jgi:hypothetical protein